jgi:hypothetical protein
VLSLIGKDSFSLVNPLAKILIERVVLDELRRSDSPAVAALRRSVRERFREQVSGQAVIDVLEALHPAHPESKSAEPMTSSTSASAVRPRRTPVQVRTEGSLVALVNAGRLPPDAALECKVYGVTHGARLRDGKIELNGMSYDSPSAAAAALRGGKASNGWVLWKYKGELLAALRARLASGLTTMERPTAPGG